MGDSTDEVIKLGILYLLINFCLSKSLKKTIESKDVLIVDSPKVEEYPWGIVSYQMTIRHLLTASNYLVRKQEENKGNESYKLYGFPWAFQVWAYECIDMAANYCALLMERKAYPILNWSCSSHLTAILISLNCINNPGGIIFLN